MRIRIPNKLSKNVRKAVKVAAYTLAGQVLGTLAEKYDGAPPGTSQWIIGILAAAGLAGIADARKKRYTEEKKE